MAFPTYQAAGTTVATDAGAAVAWPAHATDDIGVLIIEYDPNGGTDPASLSGWTQFTGSPVKTGTTPGTSTALSVWWRRATSGSEGDVTVPDAGNHFVARIITIRGCPNTGDPFNVVSSGSFSDTEDTSQSIPGATTSVADCLVLLLCTNGANFASNTWSSLTNSDLANLTERDSAHNTIANGGGFLIATGEKASGGTYGTTTVTSQRTSAEASISIAFKPASGPTILTAESGSYSVTGTVSDADIVMPADSGSYSISGTVATTFKSIILAAATGAYSLVGYDLSDNAFPVFLGFGGLTSAAPPTTTLLVAAGNIYNNNCPEPQDYHLLICETADQAVTLAVANGFTELAGSPVSAAGAASSATRLTIFERLWNGTDNLDVTVNVPSDHIVATMLGFRASHAARREWNTLSEVRGTLQGEDWEDSSETTEDTSGTMGTPTNGDPSPAALDRLMVGMMAFALPDSNTLNTQLSGVTNSDLGAVTELVDFTSGANNGGGLGAWSGQAPFSFIGGYDPTTFTWATGSYKAMLTLSIRSGVFDPEVLIGACPRVYFIFGGTATFSTTAPESSGEYGIAGTDATLIGPEGGTTLVADSGSYSHTGDTATIIGRSLQAVSGSYSYAGDTATIIGRALLAASGSYAHIGEPTMDGGTSLAGGAESGTYAIAGAGGGGGSGNEVGLTPPAPKGTDSWVALDDGARHWRFYGRYRRGMRRGNIH